MFCRSSSGDPSKLRVSSQSACYCLAKYPRILRIRCSPPAQRLFAHPENLRCSPDLCDDSAYDFFSPSQDNPSRTETAEIADAADRTIQLKLLSKMLRLTKLASFAAVPASRRLLSSSCTRHAITDKVYLVLGANGGIGSDLCKRLLESGGKVAVACRNETSMAQLVQPGPFSDFYRAESMWGDGSAAQAQRHDIISHNVLLFKWF